VRTTLACIAVLTVITGCADQPKHAASSDTVRVAPTPTPTPTPVAKPVADPNGVAVPTCLGPEVTPDWWTPNCGDAGYEIEPIWNTWTATSATAHGRVTITHGPDAGKSWHVHAVFDRPRHVAAYGGRPLFSRLVVHYDAGPGPNGTATDTWPLEEIWQTALTSAG
jgi:hypothetical protein